MTEERLPPLSAAAAGDPAEQNDEGSEDVIIEDEAPVDDAAEERKRRRKARAKLSLRIPDDEVSRPDQKVPHIPADEAKTQELRPVDDEPEAVEPEPEAAPVPIVAKRIISVGPPPTETAERIAEKTVEMAALTPSVLDVVAAAEAASKDDGKTPHVNVPAVIPKEEDSIDVSVDEDLGSTGDLSSGDIVESLTVPRPLDPRPSSIPPPAPQATIVDREIPPPPKRPSTIPPPPASSEPLEIDEVEAAAVLSSRPPPRKSTPPPKIASMPPSPPIPSDAMASNPRVAAFALVDSDEADNVEGAEPEKEAELDTEDLLSVESVKTPVASPPPTKATSTPPTPRKPSSDPPRGPASPQVAGKAPVIAVPAADKDAAASSRKRAKFWWEELFNDDFLRATPKVTDKQVAAEVDFVEDSLAVAKGGTILDLGCGTGRHAIELTRRGYAVVGFDLSLAMLSRAADEAQDRDQKINFTQGDMREMSYDERFDGIYCWGTTFGFFDEEKNMQVLKNTYRALRHGGQFLLDVANRDFIIHQSPSLAWFEGEGCVCMDEMAMDWITSRMKVKRTMMMDDGRNREVEYSIRMYSLHELGKMLHEIGFRVCEVSGRTATPGVFLGPDSPRTLILAEKP